MKGSTISKGKMMQAKAQLEKPKKASRCLILFIRNVPEIINRNEPFGKS